MKRETNIFLTVLEAKFRTVRPLRRDLYLVEGRKGNHSWWGIYSSKVKEVVSWGNQYKMLSPDLYFFERIIRYSGGGDYTKNFLFSLGKGRLVSFGEYDGSFFELYEKGWVKGYFSKKVGTGANAHRDYGTGVFDTSKEAFVIKPEYKELIPLGGSRYYGIKESPTGKETYFLISIDKEGKATTRKTERIA